MSQFTNIIRLSFRDYGHEWRISGCFILALASVLAPMMILFGLKFGIVTTMIDELVENPINREIKPINSGQFNESWMAAMAEDPSVEFIIPRTRALAASIQLKSETAKRILSTELHATAADDPLLSSLQKKPLGYSQVVLNKSAADKLNVSQGDVIDASLARQYRGKRQRVHLPLTVTGITSQGSGNRSVAYVSLELLVATEFYKDGRQVLALGWEGDSSTDSELVYPSFRLYARSIYDVEALVAQLEQQGIAVNANVEEITWVRSIDRNLSIIFWIIALVGTIGFSFSLGASLWANVDRKRKELSVLRLVGFKSGRIVLFPILQSLYTAVMGWLLATLVYLLFEFLINNFLAPQFNVEHTLCFLLMEHFGFALLLTVVVAIAASLLGGLRASRIEPSDGLREI